MLLARGLCSVLQEGCRAGCGGAEIWDLFRGLLPQWCSVSCCGRLRDTRRCRSTQQNVIREQVAFTRRHWRVGGLHSAGACTVVPTHTHTHACARCPRDRWRWGGSPCTVCGYAWRLDQGLGGAQPRLHTRRGHPRFQPAARPPPVRPRPTRGAADDVAATGFGASAESRRQQPVRPSEAQVGGWVARLEAEVWDGGCWSWLAGCNGSCKKWRWGFEAMGHWWCRAVLSPHPSW